MLSQTARPLAPASASALDSSALAAYCKASGDPLRLEILRLLSCDSYGVLELSRILDMPQSGMSHHLKILSRAGLVATRREGNSIFYRRAPLAESPELEPLQRALFASVDQLVLGAQINARIAAVQAERTRYSQQFFAENADRFRQQQELIAAFEVYGPQAAEMLGQCFPRDGELALEVGPGEGAFLAELAPRFRRVVALDNAPTMLEQARQFARTKALANIEFIEGDTGVPALKQLHADCAVLNMVLHHVPSPAHLFDDLAQALRDGGSLFVTELCRHDQQWAEQACGDVWLGFEPEDLTQWARAAGFSEGRSVYLAQRNGFRVQIRQFIRGTSLEKSPLTSL
jgi:ArsR family transcriptional regulator